MSVVIAFIIIGVFLLYKLGWAAAHPLRAIEWLAGAVIGVALAVVYIAVGIFVASLIVLSIFGRG